MFGCLSAITSRSLFPGIGLVLTRCQFIATVQKKLDFNIEAKIVSGDRGFKNLKCVLHIRNLFIEGDLLIFYFGDSLPNIFNV